MRVIHIISLIFIIGGTFFSYERITIVEHIIRNTDGIGVPLVGDNNRLQLATIREHTIHIIHLVGLETGKVEIREVITPIKHIAHFLHFIRLERGQIQPLERTTTFKHISHVGYFGGIELGQVQQFDIPAISEHPVHIRHFGGIKPVEVLYLRRVFKVVEHIIRTGRQGIIHRSVERDFQHVLAILCIGVFPPIVYTIVGLFLAVVVESEGLSVGAEETIDGRLGVAEITRIIELIHVRIIHIIRTILHRCPLIAHKARTAFEHTEGGIGNYFASQVHRTVNALQRRAVKEHTACIVYVREVKRTEVERLQRRTAAEHIAHIFYHGGIKVVKKDKSLQSLKA